MIYLDNAATGGVKPETVRLAVAKALEQCANPGRSGHTASVRCAEQVFRAREALSRYFDGYGAERVAFTKNCTEALNIAIRSLRGHVVTTELEHNSVLRPLLSRGNVSFCPADGGGIDPYALVRLVRRDTEAVILTLASNVTGYAPDFRLVRKLLPDRILLVCDGAQYCGHLPLSLRKSGIDALAVAGHKGMLGIQGSGALLFSDRFHPVPVLYGGTGTESFSAEMPDYYPERLEAGTLSYPAIVSLLAGTQYLEKHGEQDESARSALLHREMSKRRVFLYSAPNPFGILSFAHAEIGSEEFAALLSERYDIAVRGGLHCAPRAHAAIDRTAGGSVRASFGFGNTDEEISPFLAAIDEIVARA